MQSTQSIQANPNTLVIEAWLHPLSALTPSLILHNLGLQVIRVNETGMTVSIDRGHYDCTDTNYARIVVRTKSPIAFSHPTHATHATTFCCSFFSQKATVGMDSTELHSHWLGNCNVYLDDDKHGSGCSYRHESGHAKTWRKAVIAHVNEANEANEDAVSVEPCPPRPRPSPQQQTINNTNHNNKANAKDHLRIIQLQKQNFLLRTAVGELMAQLGTMRTEMAAMQMRQNEQEVWNKRANQCMQDWTNKQVIERVWILETQHAVLRSEHLKQKEQQQEQRQQEQRQQEQRQRLQQQQEQEQRLQQQQQEQPQKLKCKCKCKSLLKKQKKQHETVCSEIVERMARLEENINGIGSSCNKCNDNKCNDNKCNKCNDDDYKHTAFDFNAIYNYYDEQHYSEDECPALDLISNHYADFDFFAEPVAKPVPEPVPEPVPDEPESYDDDDDMFELIQIEVVPNFDLPK